MAVVVRYGIHRVKATVARQVSAYMLALEENQSDRLNLDYYLWNNTQTCRSVINVSETY